MLIKRILFVIITQIFNVDLRFFRNGYYTVIHSLIKVEKFL